MICNNCGATISDGTVFCEHCGAQVSAAAPQQPVYQQPVYQQPQQPVYQQPVYQQPQQPVYQQPVYQQPAYQQPAYQPQINQPGADMPMGWFKFLIYFSLFAGAVLNAITGIMAMTGAQYNMEREGMSELVYRMFDGLQAMDMIMGIGSIALAAFAIYTRMRLAGYYENGPKMLTVLYIAAMVVPVIYLVGVIAVVPGVENYINFTSQISSIAASVVMVVVNNIYFKKRAHLFVNK